MTNGSEWNIMEEKGENEIMEIRYYKNNLYLDTDTKAYLNKCNDTFEWVLFKDGCCDEYGIETFKEAIQDKNIFIVENFFKKKSKCYNLITKEEYEKRNY